MERSVKSDDGSVFDPRSALAISGEGRTVSKYPSNKVIVAQGDLVDALFYILQGKVKLEFLGEDGKQAVLPILGTGEFFGQHCLVNSEAWLFSACAVTDCTVTRLEKSCARRLLKEEPEFCELFVSFLLRSARRMQEDIIGHLVHSSQKRLARLLLLLAYDQESPSELITPHFSHEALAEMVGTTRSRVNSFMNEFRRLGHIEYKANGKLRVHSSLVEVLLGHEPPVIC